MRTRIPRGLLDQLEAEEQLSAFLGSELVFERAARAAAEVERDQWRKAIDDLWASDACNTTNTAKEHAKVITLQARVHALEQTIRVSREKGIPPPLDRSER